MINKDVITPLYIQVANELRRDILSNKYGEHGCMETQTQLATRFSVSLITIRKAIEVLANEGLVEILQGKGTYVCRSSFVDPLHNLTGMSNLMSSMNMENTITVPKFELMETPEWLDVKTRGALGETCIFIRRVLSVDDVPYSCTDMYLPGKFWGTFTREEVEEKTVYRIYQDKLGIALGRGKQIIRASGAIKEVADVLNIEENAPVLQIVRRAYDTEENMIEYMFLTYEAKKYCFEVDLELSKA